MLCMLVLICTYHDFSHNWYRRWCPLVLWISIPMLVVSWSLRELSSESAPACFGLLKVPSCWPTQQRTKKVASSVFSGQSSIWVQLLGHLWLWALISTLRYVLLMLVHFVSHVVTIHRPIQVRFTSSKGREGISWFLISVGNGTYVVNFLLTYRAELTLSQIGFLVLTIIGVFIPLIMVNPSNMIRTDGTKISPPRHPSWKTEFIGLVVTIKTDPLIVMLFPMFLASNWFYTWRTYVHCTCIMNLTPISEFNDYNGAIFNIRARSLNSFLYWISQIVGSISIGYILDMKSVRRRMRAFTGWTILFILVWIVHIWAYFYQRSVFLLRIDQFGSWPYRRQYTREILSQDPHRIDIYERQYVGRVFLYILCGILDAVWQTTSYWIMGAMSNDPAKLAYYSGFCESSSAHSWATWADYTQTSLFNRLELQACGVQMP